MTVINASSGLMHLASEMYRDVKHMETVEIPDEFFDLTFIRHLMLATEETRKEMSGLTPSTKNIPFTASTVLDTGVIVIFTYTER
jgi:hypothetical protein